MATSQQPPTIPGVPLGALDAVTDPNVRDVLQALIDGWHVRNGAAGNGDNRFITAAEVGLTGGRSGLSGQGGGPIMGTGPGAGIKPGDISRILTDLQAQVIESPLFKLLGERIDLIDKPGGIFTRLGQVEIAVTDEVTQRKTADTAEVQARTALGTRVGAAEGAIATEQTLRANADNVIVQSVATQFANVNSNLALVQNSVTTVSNSVASQAQQISQVQASTSGFSAAIQQVAQASADADGQINARYAVKVDNNGYVSGYGLMSLANNSVPFAEFIVRADRFAIGSPSGPGITPQVPFIVTTTGSYTGGQYSPPGVYIDQALIKNGAIGAAKIGDAEIGTLKLAGASVTIGVYDSGGYANIPASQGGANVVTLISRTVDLGDGYNTGVIVVGIVAVQAAANASYGVRIMVNGSDVGSSGQSLFGGYTDNIPVTGFAPATGRYATVELQIFNIPTGPGSNVSSFVTNSSIAIFGGKR